MYVVYGKSQCIYSRLASEAIGKDMIEVIPRELESCADSCGHKTWPKVYRPAAEGDDPAKTVAIKNDRPLFFVGGYDDMMREVAGNASRGGGAAGGVDRGGYEEWEKKAVRLARAEGKLMTKQKIVAVATPPAVHPAGGTILLHHMGKGVCQPVWYGWKKDEFLWPATDSGGLTNLRTDKSTPPKLQGKRFGSSAAESGEAYREWLRLSHRQSFPRGTKTGFVKWAKSLPKGSVIGFAKIGPEKRFVIGAAAIEKALGAYYVKTFVTGGAYVKADAAGLWFACSARGEPKATPNLNRKNMSTDYIE